MWESYEKSSARVDVTETATSSTAPIAPIMTAARSKPSIERLGIVEARRLALSLANPVNCHVLTIIQPTVDAAMAPPRAPKKATIQNAGRLTTRRTVIIETAPIVRMAKGIGATPLARAGTYHPNSTARERRSPARALKPAFPAEAMSPPDAKIRKAMTQGILYRSLIEYWRVPSSKRSQTRRYLRP